MISPHVPWRPNPDALPGSVSPSNPATLLATVLRAPPHAAPGWLPLQGSHCAPLAASLYSVLAALAVVHSSLLMLARVRSDLEQQYTDLHKAKAAEGAGGRGS